MSEIDLLENLVKMTRDSVNGYREAADLVRKENPPLAGIFEERSIKRDLMLGKLRSHLAALDPDNSALQSDGTVSGHVHQSFMKFRSMFQDNYKAALAEVDRGESLLVNAYEEALGKASPEVSLLLHPFLTEIRQDERTVELLREEATA
jgi:uncharacterized protein (TIGR02284 family)